MIKWIKPSGVEVETNEDPANIEAAKALGWKRVKGSEVSGKTDKQTNKKD